MLEQAFPKPAELKAIEQGTLRLLASSPTILHAFPDLAGKAAAAWQMVLPRAGRVSFHGTLVLDIEGRSSGASKRRVDIGALIEVDSKNRYTNVSYQLSIAECDAPSRILRKVHFDFEPGAHAAAVHREKKPTFHLQVCGELMPQMREQGFNDGHLETLSPWLSKPRVWHTPMSLALLLHMVFLEFQGTEGAWKILAAPDWHNHVAEVEKRVLAPYFKACHDMLSCPNKRLLTTDVFYG